MRLSRQRSRILCHNDDQPMWIDSLSLRNFRGFRELELDLRRQLTVLIGVNGSGKSTVVHALRVLPRFLTGGLKQFFWAADVRRGEEWLELETRSAKPPFHRLRYGVFEGIAVLESLPTDYTEAWAPTVLCLGSDRNRLVEPVAAAGQNSPSPTHFEHAEHWFRWREDLENQERVRTRDFSYEDGALGLVRGALESLVPHLKNVRVEREDRPGASSLVFDKSGEAFSADMLSDGEKSLVVFGVEIVKYIATLRDEASLPDRKPTIVIDEVELHLHPTWQRVVVPRLLEAFPNCQFVITTHSPQVIGSVDVESLFILENFAVRPALHPTRGRDSNAILEEIMGATSRDPETETELDEAARLVEVGSEGDAKEAVENLAERFGDDDREVVRLRTALLLRGA